MKYIFSALVFFAFTTFNLVAQNRSIEVFTYQQSAAFIPYINGEAKSTEPVMSYKYETTKDEPVQLLIHFQDPYTGDIYKFVEFSGIKTKKYEVVLKKKATLITKYEGINKDKQRPAYDKYELKDLSFQNYVKKTVE